MWDYTAKIESKKHKKIIIKPTDNKLKLKNYFENKTYNPVIINIIIKKIIYLEYPGIITKCLRKGL